MFKFVAASFIALAGFVAAQAPANDPSINSPPSLVQCQPVQLTWSATKEPVWISIIPGGQPGAATLHDFGQQAPGTKSLTWTCDYKTGTSITFQIRDSAGAVAYSGNMNVQSSSDSSCVDPNNPAVPAPGTSSAGSSAAQSTPGSATSAPAAPAPAPATTTRAAAASTTVSTRAPAAATSATPSSGSNAASNGALPGAQIGWASLMGVLAALIVA